MNARQAASVALKMARVPLRAAGIAGAIAGFALDLAKGALVQRAEAKRIRILDKRKKVSHA